MPGLCTVPLEASWLHRIAKVDPVQADPEEMGYKPEWGEHHGPVTYTPDYWNYGPKGYYSPPIPMPKKLYHATPYPDAILEQGFILPKDLENKTFGGGDEFMSFSSLENATRYKTVIQDLARVANGEVDNMQPIEVIQYFGEKWQVESKAIDGLYRDMIGDREKSPRKAALFFFGYIHNYEGGRDVPFIFGNSSVLDNLREINPDDVGVIEVETQPLQWHKGTNVFHDTDMSQSYTYNRHENEWRVYSPDAIRPVRRVS